MKKKLKDIARIKYGPYEKTLKKGNTKYLQASHFGEFGQFTDFNESFIDADESYDKFVLKPNDVIYASKGSRVFAWSYHESVGRCIPSSLFYIIRANSSEILGDYLAYYLNTERVEYLIKNKALGGVTQSIPKKELMELEIIIPPLDEQHKIVAVGSLLDHDIQLTEKLLIEKKNLKKGLITQMISNQIQT